MQTTASSPPPLLAAPPRPAPASLACAALVDLRPNGMCRSYDACSDQCIKYRVGKTPCIWLGPGRCRRSQDILCRKPNVTRMARAIHLGPVNFTDVNASCASRRGCRFISAEAEAASQFQQEALQTYWDHVAGHFAGHMVEKARIALEPLIDAWRRTWIDRFCSGLASDTVVRRAKACTPLYGRRVAEYGIGTGVLARYLLTHFNVSRYDGIDISARQLNATANATRSYVAAGVVRLYHVTGDGVEFAALRPDTIITQSVIQHFPSLGYMDQFLSNVERSGARHLMLQIRERPGYKPCCRTALDYSKLQVTM